MIIVRWPDGTRDQAKTWKDLMALLQKEHEDSIKKILSERAYLWSQYIVNPRLGDRAFVEELARASMLVILSGEEEPMK